MWRCSEEGGGGGRGGGGGGLVHYRWFDKTHNKKEENKKMDPGNEQFNSCEEWVGEGWDLSALSTKDFHLEYLLHRSSSLVLGWNLSVEGWSFLFLLEKMPRFFVVLPECHALINVPAAIAAPKAVVSTMLGLTTSMPNRSA